MHEIQMFLGIPLDAELAQKMQALPSELLSQFVKENDEIALQHFVYQGRKYLGKFIGITVDSVKLELFELNIRSMIKKLFPDHEISRSDFILLPVQTAQVR